MADRLEAWPISWTPSENKHRNAARTVIRAALRLSPASRSQLALFA
jgi:hypothetical protein